MNEPKPIDMVTDLHRAVYGDSWARSETPEQVWEMLLGRVRDLASGMCGECIRRADSASSPRLYPPWVMSPPGNPRPIGVVR